MKIRGRKSITIEAFKNKVRLTTPTMHGEEMKYVKEAYDTNCMSTVGENINQVEQIAAEKAGMKFAVALSCCTALFILPSSMREKRFMVNL